ncbi:hypothetical protein [Kribbella deserti]|uniref:Uncharacterized protein n=1 Tax=Kribbella deserti TaxID=1926257 RepID=A0ABV6QDX9_9ACTN
MPRSLARLPSHRRRAETGFEATRACDPDGLVTVTIRRPGWADPETRIPHRTKRLTAHWLGLAWSVNHVHTTAILRHAVDQSLISIPLTWLIGFDPPTDAERDQITRWTS